MKNKFEVRIGGVKYCNPITTTVVCMEGKDKIDAIKKTFRYLKKHNLKENYCRILTFTDIEVIQYDM